MKPELLQPIVPARNNSKNKLECISNKNPKNDQYIIGQMKLAPQITVNIKFFLQKAVLLGLHLYLRSFERIKHKNSKLGHTTIILIFLLNINANYERD